MSVSAEVGAAIVGAVAALGGVAITQVSTERSADRRWKRELADRWDRELASLAGEFVATTRRLWHLSGRLDKYPEGREKALARLDSQHEQLRSLWPQLAILAPFSVQRAARGVVREVFAVREKGEGRPDPRPGEMSPEKRLEQALEAFQVALREHLGLPDPDEIVRARDWSD